MFFRRLVVLATLGLVAAAPPPACAELVFLSTGRTLSVKTHRVEDGLVVLSLRSGGEITCDRSAIVRIEPDEVPYPEPAPSLESVAAATPLPSVPYAEIIDQVATEHGVSPTLVRALIRVESGYQPRARSRTGAIGLMQLMPATARAYDADPYDPRANIVAGIKHLKALMGRYSQLSLALAAYNAGEAAVSRFRGIPPYPETRNYIRQILALSGLPSGS